MNRRRFITTLGGAMGAAAGLAARVTQAQQSGKPRRVGFLAPGPQGTESDATARRSFADAFRKRGYEEGKNLQAERRYAEGKVERLPALARELIDLNVEVIVAMGNWPALAAKAATRTTPIVMASAYPIEMGLIESHPRPGGNITGVDLWSFEFTEKLYQLLKDAVPTATRAARIWFPHYLQRYGDEHLQKIHATTGLTVVSASMTRAEQLQEALDRVAASRAEVLYVHGADILIPHLPAVAAFAAERKIVSISERPLYTLDGGLLHYAAVVAASLDRIADHVVRILHGAKPADIPVEQPTRFELVLNAKTAKAMGVMLPRAFMAQVTRLIE
jgi:putative ABC transport system substrate-binding protein